MTGFASQTGVVVLFALSLTAAVFPPAAVRADALLYDTSAVLDRANLLGESAGTISGPSVISFDGVTNGTFNPPGPLNLGEFVITPSGSGVTTYNHTPFSIEIDFPALNTFTNSGPEPGEHYGSVLVQGFLNGTVSPTGQSTVTALVDSTMNGTNSLGPFPAVSIYFDSPFAPGALQVAGTLNLLSSDTPVPATVPEPSSLAAFALALGGLALWRRGRG